MNIPHQFPVLEKFLLPESQMFDHLPNYGYCFDNFTQSAKSVKKLQLPSNISKDVMGKIGLVFPNLRKLTVGYQTDAAFQQIWTLWPKLEYLSLCANGYDEEKLNEFLGLDNLMKEVDLHHPSITNLCCKISFYIYN